MATRQRTAAQQRTEHQTATLEDWLSADDMRVLEAACDALIPSVAPPEGGGDPHGLYARKASDLHVPLLVAEALAHESPQSRADFKRLLKTLDSPLIG